MQVGSPCPLPGFGGGRPGLLLFGDHRLFGAFDWLMSLEARWFSTIFGLYNVAGMLSGTVAAVAIVAVGLNGAGLLPALKPDHLHDLGKLMFGFGFLGLPVVSQFMLIWCANCPKKRCISPPVGPGAGAWSSG